MEKKENRRDFLKKSALLSAGAMVGTKIIASTNLEEANENNLEAKRALPFYLPELGYAYDALEPHIDKMTMEIHHSKHHQGYVNNLINALDAINSRSNDVANICSNISKYNTAIRNNAGGHYNHSLFWKLMSPKGGGEPTGKIKEVIDSKFNSFEKFKELFNDAAAKRFGSGWAWLVKKDDGSFEICSTPNQDNPLMDDAPVKGTPIIGLDVWEHAYYLKYQNKRAVYTAAWWNVINWEEVNSRL